MSPILLLGGAPVTAREVNDALGRAPCLVCADGGADSALAAGHVPEAVIGDFDSISDAARAAVPAARQHVIAEQDSTDFGKCLRNVDAPYLLALGFLGARCDHDLAAFAALARHDGAPCLLLGAEDVVLAAPLRLRLDLPVGTRLSLFPMGPVTGRSAGLEWPIEGIAFAPDGKIGTSNRVSAPPVTLEFDAPGMLVILPRAALDAVLDGLRSIG